MKKRIILLAFNLLLIFWLQSGVLSAQHKLYLLNPTVGNIENMLWMTENKVIDIPDLELIGVYSTAQVYDFSLSEKFLKERGIRNYRLLKVEGTISEAEVYRENSWTPIFKEIVRQADAILFFGGPDIQPSLYGEQQHLLTVVTDPGRHLFETSFFFQLIGGSRNPSFQPLLNGKPDLVVRAFCLGMQTMNVAAGGTLLQDIPLQRYRKDRVEEVLSIGEANRHRNYKTLLFQQNDLMWGFFHPVKISRKGYLQQLAEKSGQPNPFIYSSHHQAVGKRAKSLEVIALSPDGKLIEGLQHKQFRQVVGVQFHPEPPMLFQPEAKAKLSPTEEFSPNEFLQRHNSLLFHQLFWKDFSDRVKAK